MTRHDVVLLTGTVVQFLIPTAANQWQTLPWEFVVLLQTSTTKHQALSIATRSTYVMCVGGGHMVTDRQTNI